MVKRNLVVLAGAFLTRVLVVMSMGIGKPYNENGKKSIFQCAEKQQQSIEKDVLVVDKLVPLEDENQQTHPDSFRPSSSDLPYHAYLSMDVSMTD